MIIAAIVILICIITILYVISTQKQFVKCDEGAKNSLSQIGVQLDTRWSALLAMAKSTADYAKHESDALVEVIQARRPDASVKMSPTKINESENAFSYIMGRLFALQEAYPDLKAAQLYQTQMEAINNYEDKVRISRMVYNDNVTKMNRLVRAIPSNFVANMFNFSTLEYLEQPQVERRDNPIK